MAVKYPNDFGIDLDNPISGACGRLQNFLLWDGEPDTPDSRGGPTFGEVFGGGRDGKERHPFALVVAHCMTRLTLATRTKDNEGKPFLHKSRIREIAPAGGALVAALAGHTLQELMETPNENWDSGVEEHSRKLKGLGISLAHMHRANTDPERKRLKDLFDPQQDDFYGHLGNVTPAQLFTSAWDDPTVPHNTVKAANEAHALGNNLLLPDTVDPREPL